MLRFENLLCCSYSSSAICTMYHVIMIYWSIES